MGTKKLEIGSCQWLLANKDDPAIARVWKARIAECESRQRAREAKRMAERLNAALTRKDQQSKKKPRM